MNKNYLGPGPTMIWRALASLLFVLCLGPLLRAEPLFEGQDLAPVLNAFKGRIGVLAKPIVVYSWSSGDPIDNRKAQWAMIQRQSQTFWGSYGTPNGHDFAYGFGLYTAMDPVSSNGFGGLENWRLMEIELPAGFRILDFNFLQMVSSTSFSPEAEALAASFGCPPLGAMEKYFESGGEKLTPRCRSFVKEVFANQLAIDGFAYSYMQSHFESCKWNSSVGDRAIVITSPTHLDSEGIFIYSAKTKARRKDRIRLQTLFLEEKQHSQLELYDLDKQTLLKNLELHPELQVTATTSTCEGATCRITIKLCDESAENCLAVDLSSRARPGGALITPEEAASTDRHGLLWSDLNGVPKSTTTKEWLKETQFGCDGSYPYLGSDPQLTEQGVKP